MAVKNLSNAKKAKNDEFYTQMNDIATELYHYRHHFVGKKIFLNCDDPRTSNFWQYFELNFDELKLEKLTSTHYDPDEPTYKLEMIRGVDVNGDGIMDKHDIVKTPLLGNGDFRSAECIELLKEADIVITNPPFSLFREYISQLMEYEKKFIVLGNMNAITYKEVFPLIKDNLIWAGYGFNLSMIYKTPYVNELEANRKFVISHGYDPDDGYVKVPAVCWFTNLDIEKRHDKMTLWKDYEDNKEDYPQYDNYNAIEVGKVSEIPRDYYGVMGVPITFLSSHSPEQFKILGLSQKVGLGLHSTKKYDDYKEMRPDGTPTGASGKKMNGNPVLSGMPKRGNYYINDKAETAYSLYARIFIQRVDQPEEPKKGDEE